MSEERCGVYERGTRGRERCKKPATKCLIAGGNTLSYHYFCDDHLPDAIARAGLGDIPIVRIKTIKRGEG
jgi:hypothetical protein